MANKARIISEEELNELYPKNESKSKNSARIISEQELEDYTRTKSLSELNETATIGDYLRAVPATGVDITAGAAEGFASAIGAFTGDYDLARSISKARTDINDVIMGDAPDSAKSDFTYKLASGLGSTIPYLGAALLARKPSLLAKVGANGFFLASAGQQVRDDYLGTQGVTSETATDEQMSESNKVGAIGAIPIAMAEKLGAGVILGAFKGGAIPAGQVMQRISQYAAAGAGEAATEVAQSGIINSIASYVGKYDPERPITQGMAESALIGFLVGGGVNAGIDTVERAVTQADRLQAGVKDGSINAKDVIDEDIGSKFAAIAMENDGVPEADGYREAQITDPKGMSNFISKTLTPLSQRLGRAGKEVVREFRKYEMNTGLKLKEFKDATSPFSKKMLELKKKSPEDYKILSQALANANELSAPLPSSVQKDLEQKAQLQPEVTRSASEQLLDTTNENAQTINEQIGLARKALESSGLKTRIQVVESGNSYYDPSTNTIAISATEADTTTVAHEYFHAVLGQAVKTDVELQSMTRNMFDSVIRATVSGSSINEQLKGFVSQYDSNVQNEEFLAQTVGELASQYETLDINTRTRVKVWINQVMQKLGVSGVFKEAETDAEVIDQLNAFARFAGKPEALTGRVGAVIQNENNGGSIISEPIRATKFVLNDLTMAPKVSFSKKPRKNSNINSGDSLDIVSLLNDAVANNKKVVFWQSDQLGIGTYISKVTGKKYELDAGLGFAKSKIKGRDEFVWATGSESVADQIAKADLVFMVSGDPETQHLFNEEMFNIIYDNVEASQGSVDSFIKNLSRSKNTADITLANSLGKIQSKFDSKDSLKGSPARKEFNVALSNRMLAKKGQGATDEKLWSEMNKIFPFADEVRDGHLADNGFGVRDIYAAFAPNGETGINDEMHSTYNVGVGGEFLGTPDRVVNAIDVLSNDYVAELYENPKNQTSKGPISEGQLGAKVVGAQATYATYNGKDLKETTPQQVSDAIARDKPVKLAKPKPATPEQIKSGAKAARKQLDRSTASVNFRKWFGDSKVVDKSGKPMVVYHGTGAKFDTFDLNAGEGNDLGFHFGTKAAANDRLDGIKGAVARGDRFSEGDPSVMEVFLKIENPLRLDETRNSSFQLIDILNQLFKSKKIHPAFNSDTDAFFNDELMVEINRSYGGKEEVASWDLNTRSESNEWINNYLKSKGYDGIVYKNAVENKGEDSYIVFDPTQIKSATDNLGTYDPNDPNIKRQKERKASVNFRKWMGKGQLIHDDGEPMVLYHGSKQDDITSFKSARSEGLIFFSTNPEFAENWVRGIGGIRDRKSPAGIKQREEREKRNREQDKEWERSVDWNRVEREQDTLGESPYYEEMYKKHPRKSRMSDMVIDTAIYPVYLNSKKIFDPRVDFKIAEDFVLREAKKTGIQSEVDATNDLIRQGQYKIGNWIAYENKPMVDFLKTKGYDTMLLSEDASAKGSDAAHETLAVFSPNMVKSATGNNGEYSLSDPDIRRQKPRTASDEEMARGLSNDGMRILQKYGMTEDYKGVRSVLDRIKGEYEDLGLDKNFIENYFPRLVQDLNGLKASYGQKTGIVDQEIRRYEKTTGQTLSDIERQMMFEKLARSNMYRSGLSAPSNMKERITDFIQEPQMKYYADPEVALDNYIDKMVNAIETKKLIGDSASGKTQGADPVAGRLGEVMDKMASEGRLRDDQINLIRGAIDARFGSHGAQYGFIKGAKNMGYLATMGNVGSTLTQLGDFYFTMVQNGLIPTVEAALGRKDLTVEDLGIAKNMVEIDSKQGGGMFSNSVNNVFKWTGLTAMDRLAKNTNINATHKVLTKGAKAGQNTNSYKKTLARLKRVQGNDAYKTIADLKNGVKSEYVIEAIYNNLADVAPISLTEMPEAYAGNPNLRIMYSLKSYTIKQFNFVRERVWTKLMQGIATKNPKMIGEASTDMMKILAFSTLANGSSDVLKSIIFNREIDEEDFMWNTLLRIFGITKYTTVQVRKEGLGTAALKTIAPPQFGMMSDVFKDAQEMERIQDMRSVKYVPFVGKLYYWAEGRGVETEEKLSRLREKPLYRKVTYPDPPRQK